MFSIIKATVQDLPEILRVINQAYRGETSRRGWTHELDILQGDMRIDYDQLKVILENGNGTFLIAKQNDFVIGTIQLRHDAQGLYVGLLSVDPDLQNAGIGRALLSAADNYAKENSFSRIYMIVISERKELIDWYMRNGYTSTNVLTPFTGHPQFGIPTKPLYTVELEKLISSNG